MAGKPSAKRELELLDEQIAQWENVLADRPTLEHAKHNLQTLRDRRDQAAATIGAPKQ
jgi:hypothetical protein